MATVPRITVVDDDRSVRDSLRSLLNSAGYHAALFESVEAFVGSGSTDKTDCLILDMRMPGASGLDLQQWLAERNHGIPIIFVSADSEAVRARALARGAVAVLPKPFSPEVLLSFIDSTLHRS